MYHLFPAKYAKLHKLNISIRKLSETQIKKYSKGKDKQNTYINYLNYQYNEKFFKAKQLF